MEISNLFLGSICTSKKAFSVKHQFSTDFVKNAHRPFIVSEITDYGAILLVPSFSHCEEYSEKLKNFTFH